MPDSTYSPKVYRKAGGDTQVIASGGAIEIEAGAHIADANGAISHNKRQRFTIAQVNAGAELLPAIAGKSYRLIRATAIAIGGAVGAVTTVDILGTQSASGVKLVAFSQASLTQNTVLFDGASGGTVLAGGASYVANDAGAAVTVGKTGSDITTATHIDINVSYVIE